MCGLSNDDFNSACSRNGRFSHLACNPAYFEGIGARFYGSLVMDIREIIRDAWQYFKIPDGCIGNVIEIRLCGKIDRNSRIQDFVPV